MDDLKNRPILVLNRIHFVKSLYESNNTQSECSLKKALQIIKKCRNRPKRCRPLSPFINLPPSKKRKLNETEEQKDNPINVFNFINTLDNIRLNIIPIKFRCNNHKWMGSYHP